ncbi:MAG: hypothetical protein VX831_03975 [Candidatus Thermoplasmatota archaeon]|nr:hypothetical protein [Candidatus Thermoplasmatota archaeon]
METPFGPFEPSVELDESQEKTLLRSLEFFEAVRTSGDGSFTVDLSEDQPLIVRNMLSGNRLELPIFEAAELDAQRLYGYPPTNHVPTRMNGQPRNGLRTADDGSGSAVDALTSIMLLCFSIESHVDRLMDDWR